MLASLEVKSAIMYLGVNYNIYLISLQHLHMNINLMVSTINNLNSTNSLVNASTLYFWVIM